MSRDVLLGWKAAGVLQCRKLYITLMHLKVTRKTVGIYISFHFAGTVYGSGQGRQQPLRAVGNLTKVLPPPGACCTPQQQLHLCAAGWEGMLSASRLYRPAY